MTRRTTVIAVVALSAILAACASSPNSGTRTSVPARRSSELITAAELENSGESNVYLAIQRLRPQWLRARPRGSVRLTGPEPQVVVYIDATRYGSLSSLQSLTVGGIYEIRRLDASEATNRFGTGHSNGAIVVRMAKP